VSVGFFNEERVKITREIGKWRR